MFKAIWGFLFPAPAEGPKYLIHDFTDLERAPGHDLTLRVVNGGEYAEAIITSLEKIQVGEVILTEINGVEMNFSVDKAEEIAPMIFKTELSHLEYLE